MKATTIIGGTVASVLGLALLYRFTTKKIDEKKAEETESKSFEGGSAATNAKLIRMALANNGKTGTNVVDVREIFTGLKTKEDFAAIEKEYNTMYKPRLMYRDLEDELQTSEYKEMVAIKMGKPDKPGMKVPFGVQYREWANRLKAGFDKENWIFNGTDEECVKAVLNEIPDQKTFKNVGIYYQKQFGENLITRMKDEFWDHLEYIKIIAKKPKG